MVTQDSSGSLAPGEFLIPDEVYIPLETFCKSLPGEEAQKACMAWNINEYLLAIEDAGALRFSKVDLMRRFGDYSQKVAALLSESGITRKEADEIIEKQVDFHRALEEVIAKELRLDIKKVARRSAEKVMEQRIEREREIKSRAERQRVSKERLIEGCDLGIVDIVKQLNQMGYVSVTSCSGMMTDHGWSRPGPTYIAFLRDDPAKIRRIEQAAKESGLEINYPTLMPLWYWASYEPCIEISSEKSTSDKEIYDLWQKFKNKLK